MAISAKLVKELRDMTGAGMMDCKKALVETDGDLEAAVEYLQVKGIAKAGKKAGRVAAEGLVDFWLAEDQKSGVLVEVNCETDFVSRNEQFQAFVGKITNAIGASDVSDVDAALELEVDGHSLADLIKENIATIGENMNLRRFERISVDNGFVAPYIHAGAQIGVLVAVEGDATDAATEFGRDVAMHVAAMKPGYLSPSDVSDEDADKQAEIFAAQMKEEGKPENIIERIVTGKMSKWRNEQALLMQPFVKNPDLSVGDFQKEVGGVTLVGFTRYEVGEGIEKQEANLADEVAAQLKG